MEHSWRAFLFFRVGFIMLYSRSMDIPDPLTPAGVKTCYARRGSIEFVLSAFTFMAGKSGTCILLIFQINIHRFRQSGSQFNQLCTI